MIDVRRKRDDRGRGPYSRAGLRRSSVTALDQMRPRPGASRQNTSDAPQHRPYREFGRLVSDADSPSDAARAEMFRAVPLSDGTETEFALGLRQSLDGRRVVLHQPGGGIGIACWLFLSPEEVLVIALLSNVTGGPVGGQLYTEIEAAFLEATRSKPNEAGAGG